MSIKITDDSMTTDRSPHHAGLWPMPEAGESPTMWRVSWLPERPWGRNEAITAMILADTIGPGDGSDLTDKGWLFVGSWAAELGLSADEAVSRITRDQEQREAGGLPPGIQVGDHNTQANIFGSREWEAGE